MSKRKYSENLPERVVFESESSRRRSDDPQTNDGTGGTRRRTSETAKETASEDVEAAAVERDTRGEYNAGRENVPEISHISDEWADDAQVAALLGMDPPFKRTAHRQLQRGIERAIICIMLLVSFVYHLVFKPLKYHDSMLINAYRSLDPMAWGGSTMIQFGMFVIEMLGEYVDPIIAMVLDFSWALLILVSGFGEFFGKTNTIIIMTVVVGSGALAFMGLQDIFDYKTDERKSKPNIHSPGPSFFARNINIVRRSR